MAGIVAALAVAGVASPLPPPVTLGQRVDLVLRFTDGAAPVAATGVTLTAQRPDGQEFVYTSDSMETDDAGVWTISLPLDQVGAWAFRARCAGPQDTAAPELVVRVLGSSILPQPAASPILVTDELEPIELPGGTPLNMRRITALPEATDPAGLALAGAQGGEARHVTWETLEAGAEAAGATGGTAAVPGALPDALGGYRPPPIIVSEPTSLTAAAHNNQWLVLTAGASLTVDWADTGPGFSCTIFNRSGLPVAPLLVGFSTPDPVNASDASTIAANGLATLVCLSWDGGDTRECWLGGELV